MHPLRKLLENSFCQVTLKWTRQVTPRLTAEKKRESRLPDYKLARSD
jgi:hypothetical protein